MRVVHFGIACRDSQEMRSIDVMSVARILPPGFITDGDSFTEWGETLGRSGLGDALHVMHVTDCDFEDEDLTRIRLSPEEVEEVESSLSDALADTPYRRVDHWVEGDMVVWSDDNYLYGPYALQSVSGRGV